MRRHRIDILGVLCLALCAFCACEGTSFQSSVPAYPVRITLDTRVGQFVHFQPTSTGSYVTVDRDGYFMDGKYVMPVNATDAWGYGGIVVYVSAMGYDAYDLACPHCAERGMCQPCAIQGANAVCPACTEEYDLLSGFAVPQKGIAREALRRLNVMNSDGRITVTQR